MKYDIIIVPCPEKKDLEDGKFPDYINGLYLGGQIRMDAAISMYKENEGSEFIIVGGYDKDGEGSQKIGDMDDFLRGECQDIKITKRPSLPCTFHNLVAIFNMWREYHTELKGRKIGLLTNFYHLPRSLRFWSELNKKEEFKNIFIPFPMAISAESIINVPPEIYNEKSNGYIFRLIKEAEGLKDIENDNYNDNCLGKDNIKFFQNIARKYPDILLTLEEREKFGF